MVKLSTKNMIPLKKEMAAWWIGNTETGEDSFIEKHTLPIGTFCGNFQWTNSGKSSVISFVAMPEPGIFNRYGVMVEDGECQP